MNSKSVCFFLFFILFSSNSLFAQDHHIRRGKISGSQREILLYNKRQASIERKIEQYEKNLKDLKKEKSELMQSYKETIENRIKEMTEKKSELKQEKKELKKQRQVMAERNIKRAEAQKEEKLQAIDKEIEIMKKLKNELDKKENKN